MAFCGNCGTQIQDGVRFCPACGASAGASAQQQAAWGQQGPGYAPPGASTQQQAAWGQQGPGYAPPDASTQQQAAWGQQAPGYAPPGASAQQQAAWGQQAPGHAPPGASAQQQAAWGQQAPGYTPPVVPGAPRQADIRDAQENKTMSILAYILFFIPLLTGAHKTSAFAKYHTNQGTVLFLFTLAWSVLYWVLTAIFTAILFNPATWAGGGWGALGVITTILSLLWLVPTILCVVGIINAAQGRMRPLPVIGGITIIR